MKRLCFLFAVILGACIIGTTAHAQFTSNPAVEKTTNTTALVPIGNGLGVALLGYGLPESNVDQGTSSNYLFFATPMGQPSASDTTVVGGSNQFYVVQTDRDGSGGFLHADYFAYKVLSPVSSPTSLTIVRTFLARIETNNVGSPQAGSIAACGVDKTGRTALRVDASSSPSGSASYQAMFLFNAETNATVVITQVLNNVSLAASCILTQDGGGTLKYGSLGKNNGLLAGNKFGGSIWGTQYVGRLSMPGESYLEPHGQRINTDNDRSAMAINDTAKVLAYWQKTDDEAALGSGSDACTHLTVFYYNDTGSGNITLDTTKGVAGSNSWAFGTRDGNNLNLNHINTNAIDFFGASAFNGPPQISINDNGEMAFPVSINCLVGNVFSNGTRSATICGILFKDANTGTFRKVVDNQDTSLFAPSIRPGPGEFWSETNNIVSPPVLDNNGNIFFTCGLTNFLIGGTNAVSDVALYQSVPTSYPNPTNWTTRIVIREGSTFVEPTSGQTNRILSIPLASSAGASRANVPRCFGANSINRTPPSGVTADLGGVILTATITNLTAQTRFDGVLYIAPLPPSPPCPAFLITSIKRTGNDVTLVWNGQVGNNVVQYSTGAAGGSFNDTHTWVDLTTVVLTSCGVASYTDVGGAANIPSRYYRIKLTP